jgi:hypothetical protein
MTMMAEVVGNSSSKSSDGGAFSERELQEATQRMKELSTSSDTQGIKFTGRALHYVYYMSKFAARGRLLFQLFALLQQAPEHRAHWQRLLAHLAYDPTESSPAVEGAEATTTKAAAEAPADDAAAETETESKAETEAEAETEAKAETGSSTENHVHRRRLFLRVASIGWWSPKVGRK